MSKDPLNDIRSNGAQRLGDGTNVLGPDDSYSSTVTLNDEGVLRQLQNNGVTKFAVRGDGRLVVPILLSPPPVPTAGDIYLEQIAGQTELVIVDITNTPKVISGGGGGAVTPTPIPLTALTNEQLSSVPVDAIGSIEWSLTFVKASTGQRAGMRLWGGHDGSLVADATTAQLNRQDTLSLGVLDITLTLSLAGVGVTQVMELEANAATPGWVAYIVVERMTSP